MVGPMNMSGSFGDQAAQNQGGRGSQSRVFAPGAPGRYPQSPRHIPNRRWRQTIPRLSHRRARQPHPPADTMRPEPLADPAVLLFTHLWGQMCNSFKPTSESGVCAAPLVITTFATSQRANVLSADNSSVYASLWLRRTGRHSLRVSLASRCPSVSPPCCSCLLLSL